MPKKDYPSREQRMKDLNQRLEQGIRDVFESGRFRDYLSVMSRFHTYSARNVLLIHMQRPNATRVASAKRWHEQFERFINKGEKAIYIMAPIPIVKTVERQKLDPDTKAPVLDENGQVVTEKREVQVPRFRPVPVFDVSQTNGKPLPQLAQDLTGDVAQYPATMWTSTHFLSCPASSPPGIPSGPPRTASSRTTTSWTASSTTPPAWRSWRPRSRPASRFPSWTWRTPSKRNGRKSPWWSG